MKNLSVIVCALLSFSAQAGHELFNPVQEIVPNHVDSLTAIQVVKVKIFPHDGPYATPQGRESRTDQALVTSEGSCLSITPDSATRGSRFTMRALDYLKGPGTLDCDRPITLEREGAKSHAYRGSLILHHVGGKLVIVNKVNFSDYLKGVVPSEMPASWPLESLKAQAVAARTYAATQILQARAQYPNGIFDVDDTVMYQAYRGVTVEHPATTRAVEATLGTYLLDQQGRPIIAYFSADSGGHTESSDNVWGGEAHPYTPSKPEVYDLRLVKSSWTLALSLAEIRSRLVSRSVLPATFKLARFEIIDHSPSGRVSKVRLTSEDKKILVVHGEKFRYGLGLRSSLFKISGPKKNEFQLQGLGYGHGVGMNQWGAKVLHESLGWDHRQILEFYYEGAQIRGEEL